MTNPSKSPKTSNFPSYGQLVCGLLAGVEAVGFFQADGKCLWISEKTAALKLELAAKETQRTGRTSRHVETQHTVAFALPLRHKDELVGILALALSTSKSKTWDMTLERIEGALTPVMTVLSHELGAKVPELKSKVLTERTEELEWLFAITSEMRSGSSDTAAVEQLLGAAVERMEAAYGGLAITEKRLNVTYDSKTRGNAAAAVAYQQTHPHLMRFVQRQEKPVVLNKPPAGRGGLSHYKIMAIPVTAQNGKVAGFIAFFKALTDADFGRREQYLGRHIARQIGALLDSQYDLATGLFTRVAFEQQANQFLEGCKDTVHSLVYVDIDQLHIVNENFGYDAGDEAIVRIADLLRPPLLPSDAIASRTSGDRFLLFLPGHDVKRAQDLAIALQKEASGIALGTNGQRVSMSLSCGVSRLLNSDHPVSRGIAAAELACKTAKERGRNRCEVYLDIDASMMQRKSDITGLGRLRSALENNQLIMYGQKIAPIGNPTHASGMECLVRMLGPDGSIVSPAEFMSVAQRYQLLKAVDEWVIQNTLRVLSPFASIMLHSGVYASINISGQSLSDESLLNRIADWVRASHVPPGRITFEITETAAVSNLPLADKLMRGLRRMGCRFALDDFGTGANSLSYLKSLQVQRVKIDGSFVRDIATNPRSVAMVGAIVQLAKSLEIDCVAEFVESEVILRRLRDLGVGYVQGHYIHVPQELESLLRSCVSDESQRIRAISLQD